MQSLDGLAQLLLLGPHPLRELYAELLAHANVRGVFIGRKRRKQRLTRRLSLVCCVSEKVPLRKLEKKQRVPGEISWSVGHAPAVKLLTDVQVLGPSTTRQANPVLGPADKIQPPYAATVGIVVQHPEFGVVVTTAGHAFRQSKGTSDEVERVTIRNSTTVEPGQDFKGWLRRSVIRELADYALIEPEAGLEAENLFLDHKVLSGIFHPAHPSDIGRQLFVLTERGMKQTFLLGLKANVIVGRFRRREVLLTKHLTRGGDSGCCLVDRELRVWGLLVGNIKLDDVRHSVFQSPHWVLQFERAELR